MITSHENREYRLKGHSFGTALTWTPVFSLWIEFTPNWNQSTPRIALQSSQCFAWFSIVYWKTCFWVCFCSSCNVVFIIFGYKQHGLCLCNMQIGYEMVSNAHVRLRTDCVPWSTFVFEEVFSRHRKKTSAWIHKGSLQQSKLFAFQFYC